MRLPALVDVTCKQVVELFGDYLEQRGMAPLERARFERHLYACTWCMDYLHQLEDARRAMRALADEGASEAPPSELLAMFGRLAKAELTAAAPRTFERDVRAEQAPVRGKSRFAFKFLTRDAKSPLALFAWPLPSAGQPGVWVDVGAQTEPCKVGIHASAPRALSSWLHETLWLIELEGPVQRSSGAWVAPRARLVHEVEAWRLGGGLRFAQAAHEHARDLVEAAPDDARAAARLCVATAAGHLSRHNVALAAFCAAMSVARLRGVDHFDQRGYDAERRWQSDWLRRELTLDVLLRAARG